MILLRINSLDDFFMFLFIKSKNDNLTIENLEHPLTP